MINYTDFEFQRLIKQITDFDMVVEGRNGSTLCRKLLTSTFTSAPLISVRKTAWKNALREMEWFLSGSDCIYDLHPAVRSWWTPWADKKTGIVKNNYSKQFRAFTGTEHTVDQIEYLINGIKEHPNSRRLAITTWNTADMIHESTPITNCHGSLIQCFVEPGNSLHMFMYQRSTDMLLGLPHNWIQYWALLKFLCHRTDKEIGSLTWMGGHNHIYAEHKKMAKRLLAAEISEIRTPELVYTPNSDQFQAADFRLSIPYNPVITERLPMIT